MWLSPAKVVFLPSKAIICDECKSVLRLVAEQSKSIKCFNCGAGCADALCFFCKHGISIDLLVLADEPSCLLRKKCGHVKFCREFEPGHPFGEDWRADLEEGRKETAEQVFAKVRFEHCVYCSHWNTENVVKLVKNGEIIDKNDADYIDRLLREGKTIDVYQDSTAAFCSLAKASKQECRCESFQLDPSDAKLIEHQRKALPLYVEALKLLEQAFPKGGFSYNNVDSEIVESEIV